MNNKRLQKSYTVSLLVTLALSIITANALAQPTPTPTPTHPSTPSTAPNQPTPTPTPPNYATPSQTPNIDAIPKPSVPEFTVKLISSPPESQLVNRTIELSIKNQPFVSNYGLDFGFFYMVRARINDGNWSLLYTIDNVPTQSNIEYTTLSYPSEQPVVEYQYILGDKMKNLFPGDKIDFQVQAMIGRIHRVFNPNYTQPLDMYPYTFTGETSEWSNTQTISIPADNDTPAPSPTVPELPWIAILPLCLIVLGVALVLKRRNASKS